jgi:hypothetical protein
MNHLYPHFGKPIQCAAFEYTIRAPISKPTRVLGKGMAPIKEGTFKKESYRPNKRGQASGNGLSAAKAFSVNLAVHSSFSTSALGWPEDLFFL